MIRTSNVEPRAPRAKWLQATLCVAALVALAFTGTPAEAAAQTTPPDFVPATVPPESERDPNIYVLNPDGRHGPSFFPRVRHPEVQYEAGETLTWDTYHTVDVMYEWMDRWAERYPELVEVYQVGTSYEGRPIMQATVTNTATGPATDKPAAFFEGGRHSGEITASESVLWLMQYLVEGYGNDADVTEVLDRTAIYLRPQNNPDGSNLYLHTAQTNRSSVRPVDQDGDGLYDNDPAIDLDGDGVVRQMRWKDPEGSWDVDPRDPQGRLMMRVEPGTGSWSVAREGGNTRDGIGGLDLHRNYPQNWRPMPGRDHTGRGYTQGGAGAYPLSEPETRSVVLFVLENPNIAVANSMDTRVPMHLRAPSTSKSSESIHPRDLALYEHFDSVGLTITGYPWAGDVYHTYATRNNPDRDGSPLFGHGPDFGYFFLGTIWYGDELWDGGSVGDVNGDGLEDDLDRLIWSDSISGGREFQPWTAVSHPEFGEVEVGGWHPKFFQQNGPPEVLGKWAGNQALFNFYLAQSLPRLEVDEPRVVRLESDADSTTWEVRIQVRNTGRLPTALDQAQLVKMVRPDAVRLQLEGVRVAAGGGGFGFGGGFGGPGGGQAARQDQPPEARFLEPGNGRFEFPHHLQPGEMQEAVLTVRTYGSATLQGTFQVLSTRGGVVDGQFRAPPR